MRNSENENLIEVDGVYRPRLNNKGRFIHTSDQGIRNFWRWFGDSRAIDNQGRPLVIYHGTGADFAEFSSEKIGKNFNDPDGFFFTNNTFHDVAHYVNGKADVYESGTSAGAYAKNSGGSPNIMPVYVRLVRPHIITEDADGAGVLSLVEGRSYSAGHTLVESKAEGFDGLIVTDIGTRLVNGGFDVIVIASEPGQIKSAIGNSGAFDPKNSDICDVRDSLLNMCLNGDDLENESSLCFS